MKIRNLIVNEGWYYIISAFVLFLLSIYFYSATCSLIILLLSVVFFAIFLIILYFFRDPVRNVKIKAKNLILSPADGTVSDIEYGFIEDEFRKEKSIRISIFMSVFNVHVQRFPVAGKIVFNNYKPGGFESVMKPEAYKFNEQNWLGLITDNGIKISIVQIAGLIAKRISIYKSVNDDVAQGEKLGHIRFGSRVDLYLPSDSKVFVKVGDNVRAGLTVVGRL